MTLPPSLGSLAHNQLCGLNRYGQGTYTADGITKLCDGLKGSAVTSLKCAAPSSGSSLCQRPLTRHYSLTVSHPAPRSYSLGYNNIGAKGATELAAILNKTEITNLKCAAAAEAFAFLCQRPLTRLLSHRSQSLWQ